ncbi:hypothetical protein [Burkholderia ubonensis]|uniref:hypothetical protein n=1 Tax=Burkholderia ubonensis TaxID=101571 RepID=UPI002AB02C65|nr:hypothetical protein [Burkholderia ubonensis]
MFSLSRAIEDFSIKRQEKRLSQKIEKDRLNALPHAFGVPLEKLRELFATPLDEIQLGYPKVEHLKGLGLEAFLVFFNVDVNAFPACFNLIKQGRGEISYNHFMVDGRHTFFNISEEFCGRNVRLLTNDIDLIKSISKGRFGPPPSWIVWYELGPYCSYTQGNPEHWDSYVWSPYWESLSAEEKDAFIADWREKTKSYISDEEWVDWVYSVRKRDKEHWEGKDD